MLEAHRGQLREEGGQMVTAIVPSTETRVSSSLAQADHSSLKLPARAESIRESRWHGNRGCDCSTNLVASL